MIINIRGTGGSGKSWVVRQLFGRFFYQPYDPVALGHILNDNTFVLGPYLTGLSTEGTDVVNRNHTQDQICARIVAESERRHVVFEGLLVSGIYGRYRDMARERDYRWVFLNTPLDACLENTRRRRLAAGKPPEFNPEATVSKYRAVRAVLAKARTDGLATWDISSEEAVDLIAEWIG